MDAVIREYRPQDEEPHWLRETGARVAMVETGGDPDHPPARRLYERADYTLLPIARYFKAL